MDKNTLTALEGSIAKWRGVVAGTIEDEGVKNCPLCHLFYIPKIDACEECPVRNKTGQKYCERTPYMAYINARYRAARACQDSDAFDEANAVLKAAALVCAQDEVEFLVSLLPKEE